MKISSRKERAGEGTNTLVPYFCIIQNQDSTLLMLVGCWL